MKIGIIQTRGLGDIVIAAPIAMYYIERGCKVYWPIDSDFINSFQYAFPKINFIPIIKDHAGDSTAEYFYHAPLEELKKKECDSIICLYSHLTGFDFGQEKIQKSMAFDAYKYAVAKVPFREKWNFHPQRNIEREKRIFELLNLSPSDSYNLIHDEGSNIKVNLDSHLQTSTMRNIKITSLTDNIFDWLSVIENSNNIYFLDSVYANLAEQMNINVPKNLQLRSPTPFTPTFISDWNYL